MKKLLLVPTDFSGCANNAINFAVQSAKLFPTEILLLHAFENPDTVYSDYMDVDKEYTQTLWHECEKKLHLIKDIIWDTERVHVSIKIYPGNLKKVLGTAIAGMNVDLVIAGTHGAGGLKGKIWGSNMSSIIGDINTPMLIIPYDYNWKLPQKILVASNRFEEEVNILEAIFSIKDLYGSDLEYITFTNEDHDDATVFIEHSRKVQIYQNLLKQSYGKKVTVKHLHGHDFEKDLFDYIGQQNIDMLVMITYSNQSSFWSRLFTNSQTKQMSFYTPIPLLVINGY